MTDDGASRSAGVGESMSDQLGAAGLVAALPSWRPGAGRDALVEFLLTVTEGPAPVPCAERIAAFDNDGTLACEKPHTALAAFLIEESSRVGGAPVAIGSGHEVLRQLGVLFAGATVTAYEQRAGAFLAEALHPRFERRYPMLVYRPMHELMVLLQQLHFSVFVCSDSSRDFMRVFAGSAYDLAGERVIGSEVRIALRDGELTREATPEPLDDGPGKVVHIWDRTGRAPLLAAGNAAGDIEMLDAARFALLVRHDDPEREYAYADERVLDAAARGRWTVLSMRDDFGVLWTREPDVDS